MLVLINVTQAVQEAVLAHKRGFMRAHAGKSPLLLSSYEPDHQKGPCHGRHVDALVRAMLSKIRTVGKMERARPHETANANPLCSKPRYAFFPFPHATR